MKGWFGKSEQHSLTSRGISVRQMKDIYNFPEVIDYHNPEEMFVAFWIASLKNDFSRFDFDKAFAEIMDVIEMYGEQIFQERHDLNTQQDVLDHSTYGNYENRKEVEELVKEIGLKKYLDEYANKDEYDEEYGSKYLNPDYDDTHIMSRDIEFAEEIISLKKELSEPMTLKDKIILMDNFIDYQHSTGSIWDEFNVDELREEFDRKYKMVDR